MLWMILVVEQEKWSKILFLTLFLALQLQKRKARIKKNSFVQKNLTFLIRNGSEWLWLGYLRSQQPCIHSSIIVTKNIKNKLFASQKTLKLSFFNLHWMWQWFRYILNLWQLFKTNHCENAKQSRSELNQKQKEKVY